MRRVCTQQQKKKQKQTKLMFDSVVNFVALHNLRFTILDILDWPINRSLALSLFPPYPSTAIPHFQFKFQCDNCVFFFFFLIFTDLICVVFVVVFLFLFLILPLLLIAMTISIPHLSSARGHETENTKHTK